MTKTPTPRRAVGSRREVVRRYLADNPGWHRPREVADGTGLDPHAVATDLLTLANDGQILRRKNSRQRMSTYSAPA